MTTRPAVRRSPPRYRTVYVPRVVVIDGADVDVCVVCEITGRSAPATYHEPADFPDIDVVRVFVDDSGKRELPELLTTFSDDESVLSDALDLDDDNHRTAYENARDSYYDNARQSWER